MPPVPEVLVTVAIVDDEPAAGLISVDLILSPLTVTKGGIRKGVCSLKDPFLTYNTSPAFTDKTLKVTLEIGVPPN